MSTNKNKERVLFIPKKLRIGFKKRPNSADGLLSYVIYFDEKNKIRNQEVEISADTSKVKIHVVPTNEELLIARRAKELCE